MKVTDLTVGIKLEMEVFDEMDEKVIPSFPSKFEAALDENNAIVYAPIFEGTVFPVHIGWKVNVYFAHKKDLFFFPAKIVGRSIRDNIPFINIEITEEIIKIQRRQFFRLEVNLPVKYRDFEPWLLDARKNQQEFKDATTIDVSGGGVSIKVDKKLKSNKLLECELFLSDEKSICFLGRVVRTEKLDEEGKQKYKAGINFNVIQNCDKEALIKFLFSEQRRLRRKGLI